MEHALCRNLSLISPCVHAHEHEHPDGIGPLTTAATCLGRLPPRVWLALRASCISCSERNLFLLRGIRDLLPRWGAVVPCFALFAVPCFAHLAPHCVERLLLVRCQMVTGEPEVPGSLTFYGGVPDSAPCCPLPPEGFRFRGLPRFPTCSRSDAGGTCGNADGFKRHNRIRVSLAE